MYDLKNDKAVFITLNQLNTIDSYYSKLLLKKNIANKICLPLKIILIHPRKGVRTMKQKHTKDTHTELSAKVRGPFKLKRSKAHTRDGGLKIIQVEN